jgi:hypothetical protein
VGGESDCPGQCVGEGVSSSGGVTNLECQKCVRVSVCLCQLVHISQCPGDVEWGPEGVGASVQR